MESSSLLQPLLYHHNTAKRVLRNSTDQQRQTNLGPFEGDQLEEPVGLRNNRLQCLSGPYFTAFVAHSPTISLRKRQNLASLSRFFAFNPLSPTDS